MGDPGSARCTCRVLGAQFWGTVWPASVGGGNTSRPSPFRGWSTPAGGLWGGSAQTSHATHAHTTRLGPRRGLPGTRWVVEAGWLLRPIGSTLGRRVGQPCSAGPSASLSLLGDSSSGLSGRCSSRKLAMSLAMASTSLWRPMTALWVRGWEKPVEKRSTTT